jgi:hypothetical protein
LVNVSVQAAISIARQEQQKRTQITADRVVTEAWHIATADARELVEVKIGCCRHCHGEGHKWQRTVAEMNYDVEQWVSSGNDLEAFEHQGGIGYTPSHRTQPALSALVTGKVAWCSRTPEPVAGGTVPLCGRQARQARHRDPGA